jgi:fucose permease
MTSTHTRLLLGLASMALGWLLAFRALHLLGAWGLLAGLAFLLAVGWGILRAARI